MGVSMNMLDRAPRKAELEALWRTARGDFLEEYKRVVGMPPGSISSAGMTVALMIEQILAREFPPRSSEVNR
jgi:hypothetical protein